MKYHVESAAITLTMMAHERVFFILEGDFLLKLQPENKMLNILSAPFVMGVSPSLDAPPLYLERVDYGKVSYVDYDFFLETVLEKICSATS